MNWLDRNSPRYAWTVVVLLVPVALLNYLDRQMLAAMKFSVMSDIPDIKNEANWGKVLALFKWTYAILSPFAGFLADRVGRRYVIFGSLLVWSAITWATGHVKTYEQLLVTRAAMGISEAFYIPAALALIADYHTGATRSRAVSLHQIGIYLGVIIGGFSGYAADHPDFGWRWMFDTCGIVGIVYSIPLVALLKNPPQSLVEKESAKASPRSILNGLICNPSFILLVLYFTLPGMAGWIVRDWMPAILKAEFGIGQGKAGVSATFYWVAACIFAAPVGGWLADRWTRRTIRGRIYTSAIGMACITIAMFGVGYAPQTKSLAVAVLFLMLFGWGWAFFDSNNMPILCQVAEPRLRATGYGIMNFVSISCGGFADWFFGILRDQQIPLLMIFGIFAGFGLLSIALVLLIRPKQPDSSGPIGH
ncbi:MAG: MFS transporter [Verrucomicrobiae bacterium]|nr:MFS transporter [Verrucomicrobiae bacterium]